MWGTLSPSNCTGSWTSSNTQTWVLSLYCLCLIPSTWVPVLGSRHILWFLQAGPGFSLPTRFPPFTIPSHSCPQSLTPSLKSHPGLPRDWGTTWLTDIPITADLNFWFPVRLCPHPTPDPRLPVLRLQFWLLAWTVSLCYCPFGHRTLLTHLTFSLKCSMAHPLYPSPSFLFPTLALSQFGRPNC